VPPPPQFLRILCWIQRGMYALPTPSYLFPLLCSRDDGFPPYLNCFLSRLGTCFLFGMLLLRLRQDMIVPLWSSSIIFPEDFLSRHLDLSAPRVAFLAGIPNRAVSAFFPPFFSLLECSQYPVYHPTYTFCLEQVVPPILVAPSFPLPMLL